MLAAVAELQARKQHLAHLEGLQAAFGGGRCSEMQRIRKAVAAAIGDACC